MYANETNEHLRLIQNKYISIKHCKHGLMMYNINDLFVGRSLDFYGEWCESELETLNQLINVGDTVVDVGANIGTHTVFFAKKVSMPGQVIAIEPQRISFQLLAANIVMNCLSNVIPLSVAVGDDIGHIYIPILDPEKEQNFAALKIEGFELGDNVRLITLDSLNLKKCNLIKIDVEGMESKVLLGAKKTILNFRPYLFIENNAKKGSPNTINILNDYGYQCYWHIANYYNKNNFFDNPQNIFAEFVPEANIVCIPKEHDVNIKGFEPVISPDDNWLDAINRIKSR